MTQDEAGERPRSGVVRRLLGIPLFYKILVANAAIVLLFSVLASVLAVREARTGTGIAGVVALVLAGAVVSVVANALILKLALEPLRLLRHTAERVQHGDMDARVPESALADRETRILMATVNGMLERLSDYRARLRDVAARALRASEEERRRISLELHDDASQRLAAVLMRLRIARGLEGEARDGMLEEVREELAEAADGLRRYAQGLRPPALDELGLSATIESHVRHLAETTSVPIDVRAEAVGRLASPEAELALYRIVQEALSNALRHARASGIRVRVSRREGVATASVADNGVGFDAQADRSGGHASDRGLGLFGMQERAEYVGGRVEVDSQPGAGTTVRVAIPTAGASAPLPADWRFPPD
ncbi:MAG TPA: sensor histidine kinase [Longimicrobiales bacterium]|nr:sensor histidine kinase [Longimicrobiales bacterium]